MVSENHCRISGMLSHGKIIPEKIIVGMVSPIPEIIRAAFCVDEMTEMRRPIASDATTNIRATAESSTRLPFTGTSIT